MLFGKTFRSKIGLVLCVSFTTAMASSFPKRRVISFVNFQIKIFAADENQKTFSILLFNA
jgi:hypothetical protein